MILAMAGEFSKRATGMCRRAAGVALVVLGLWMATAAAAQAQETTPPTAAGPPSQAKPVPPDQAPIPEQVVQNPVAPCVQPAPMVRWQDYDGKFAKVVGAFGRKLERRSAASPGSGAHYKPGAALCTLEVRDKFKLSVAETVDPLTILGVAFSAGLSQAQNSDRQFGQGAEGYAKRFGAAFADQASGYFFKDFAYPTLFFENPRYYRMGQGKVSSRFLHAAEHSVLAHRENGATMFNFSEWMGTITAASLANLYHPGNRRGFSPTAERVGYAVGSDIGFDELREFFPEIARKLKLPFRGQN
jgi:hypothetical protein